MPRQGVKAELYYDSAWHDLTAAGDVFTEPIVITRGQGDESPAPRPSSISTQLANADDKYRTSNPESPLYGKTGRNAPIRVSVGSTVRGIAEASSWTADQTQDFRQSPPRGKAWVDVEGGGLLQRINQWTQPLHSPFYRYNAGLADVAGYWPLEDPKGTQYAFTPTAGASSGPVKNLAFESQYRPPGSGPLADINTAPVSTEGTFTPGDPSSTTGWQVSWAMNLTTFDPAETYTLFFWRTSNQTYWTFLYSAGNWVLLGSSDDGTVDYAEVVPTTYDLGDAGWVLYNVEAKYSGGTTTMESTYRSLGESAFNVFSDSYTGIPSSLEKWWVTGLTLTDTTVGHVTGVSVDKDTEDLGSAARWAAFKGHAGETTAVRFGRLMDEELGTGHYYVSDGFAAASVMGPQPVATFPDLLKEIVTTEDGLLFDHRTELRLYLLCRADRYSQSPAITLAPTDFPALPKEVTDDQGTHNVVTASQRDGGEYTARDDTGPLGSLPPPDGAGEAKQTVDVNVANETTDLPQVANWWLRRGTVNLPRFPQITLDLNARPDLIEDAESVDVGSVIEIVGLREYTVRLYVLGYTETIGTHTRTITFTCAPDQQFDVGQYDDGMARYDSASTTLKTGVSSTATSVTFRTAGVHDLWSTTAEPYDVLIAGERLTVTAMGAASLVSGSYDQAATVTRSVNGIVKSLSAGEPIHIATPGRFAL